MAGLHRQDSPVSTGPTETRPRVLFVGRTRYSLPLPAWLAKKFTALAETLDYRVLASAEDSPAGRDERFSLIPPSRVRSLDGPLFYLKCPFYVRAEIEDYRPDAVIAESPYTGAAAMLGRALARTEPPRIIVEIHGDWRSATRAYGSGARRLLSPLADGVSRLVIRRGDAVRALSPNTRRLAEEVRGSAVAAEFPTYSDLGAFTARPVQPFPSQPTVLYVGMLERYKNIEGLARVWKRVAREVPDARLVIVGKGSRTSIVEDLVAEHPGRVQHFPELLPDRVAAQMDLSTVFVLPSKAEGLGRVVIESFARGRGVVACRGGGVPDLVDDGVEGILVEPGDDESMARALIDVLTDPELAARLGEAARARYGRWDTTPAEYASRVRQLVDRTLGQPGAALDSDPAAV